MSDASDKQGDERRQRNERRKKRLLPFFGKERRKSTIIREADVLEIYVPPMKVAKDRRDEKK